MSTINQKQNIEKELKFIISPKVSKEDIKVFLENLGLVFNHQDLQTDIYWDTNNFDIINLKRGLRVRYVSNVLKNIEFKSLFQDDSGKYVVEEIKLLKDNVLDKAVLEDILVNRLNICKDCEFKQNLPIEQYFSNLGLKSSVTLKKERSIFMDLQKSVEVCVDTVENLGIFLEVESVGDTVGLFEKIVEELNNSGFAILDNTHAGYLDLILSKNPKILTKGDFEKRFAENHEWNVKNGERNVFLALTQLHE